MLARRLLQLHLGLALYGLAIALRVRAELGLDPWSAFHEGLAKVTRLSFGTIVILVGALALLLWGPLRQKPGIGTISNVLVIGVATDTSLGLMPYAHSLASRFALLVAGIVLTGIASAAYIGAGLGPGPRDGLMTGLAERCGWSIGRVRTGIEFGVLAVGWLLGGSIGYGTIAYAVTIGPLVHYLLPLFTLPSKSPPSALEQCVK